MPGGSGGGLGSLRKQSSMASEGGEQIVERQQEDMVGSLSIGRVHAQLRRMKRNSNYSSHVYLTAIPEYRSKVLFTFEKPPVPIGDGVGVLTPMKGTSEGVDGETTQGSTHFQGSPHTHDSSNIHDSPHAREFDKEGVMGEDIAGFIMFECGLEDISLRAARRTGYASPTATDDDGIGHSDQQMGDPHKQSYRRPHDSDEKLNESDSDSHANSEDSGNTADDEASGKSEDGDVDGTDPDVSQNTAADHGHHGAPSADNELAGDASSGVLKVKSVWFNFAAPPPSPKKKKLEYTRLVTLCRLWYHLMVFDIDVVSIISLNRVKRWHKSVKMCNEISINPCHLFYKSLPFAWLWVNLSWY